MLKNKNDNFLNLYVYDDVNLPMYFDESLITTWVDGVEYVLYDDFFGAAIMEFSDRLKKSIDNELIISKDLFNSGIGLLGVHYIYEVFFKDNFSIYDPFDKYNVWGTGKKHGTNTWLYNLNNKIYLEVSPFYTGDVEDEEAHGEFLKNYKMILRREISFKLANYWYQCGESSRERIRLDRDSK